MLADESKCVNCQRCVALCPTRAIKIVKTDCCLRENENWKSDTIREVYKQAASRRRPALLRRQPDAAAGLLGPASHQRLADHEPFD